MPAIADKALAVLTAIQSLGNEAFVSAVKNAEVLLSVSRKPNHNNPNVAVLVLAIKNTLNLSLNEIGSNRRLRPYAETEEVIFANGDQFLPLNNKNASWFSLFANVKQGGRKTNLDLLFVEYVANALTETFGIENAKDIVANADMEDSAIRQAFAKINR